VRDRALVFGNTEPLFIGIEHAGASWGRGPGSESDR
jgi:hypothetical protein